MSVCGYSSLRSVFILAWAFNRHPPSEIILKAFKYHLPPSQREIILDNLRKGNSRYISDSFENILPRISSSKIIRRKIESESLFAFLLKDGTPFFFYCKQKRLFCTVCEEWKSCKTRQEEKDSPHFHPLLQLVNALNEIEIYENIFILKIKAPARHRQEAPERGRRFVKELRFISFPPEGQIGSFSTCLSCLQASRKNSIRRNWFHSRDSATFEFFFSMSWL